MNDIARLSIERPLYSWMLVLLCIVGGVIGIDTVGRLEDPVFPLMYAYVITPYEGASASEVEQEVTDPIEAALQELPYIEKLTSKSISGRSEVMVEIQEEYSGGGQTAQIFDELRRRVSEASMRFPPGVGPTIVEDDFGDIYGIMYAVSAVDYEPDEIHDIAKKLSTELKSVEHVAKVQVAGLPREAVYVELDSRKFARLGLPIDDLLSRFVVENQVFSSGTFVSGSRRLRIAPEMAFSSVEAIGEMRIGKPGSTQILELADVATIKRERIEVPEQIIRHEGKEIFTLGVSVVPGKNVVDVGKKVDAKLNEIMSLLPLGVQVETIYAQHTAVEESITEFLRNLILSVLTVITALCVFMGWRAGTVVGAALLLTVLGTIFIMSLAGIELQRISLGALMIAMGMLVDNGIVVAEGMVIGVRRGLTPAEAASRSVRRTQFALLGATIIGITAFGPISLSNDAGGHFLRSLFQVVAISLLLSWVLAITVVPLFGSYLLKTREAIAEKDLYTGPLYTPYRALLGFGLRRRWITAMLIVGITGACIYSAQYMKQAFFPRTNTPLFYVDYRLPEGSNIYSTLEGVTELEDLIQEYEEVEAVTSFVGRGATRFTAIMRPEQPNSSYAQLVVRVRNVEEMDDLIKRIDARMQAEKPGAQIQVTRAEFTSGSTSKFEVRFSGPDNAVLRELGEKALSIYLDHDLIDRKIDWRQPALKLVPEFNETRARLAGVTRADLAQSLAYSSQGITVGVFRDADKVIPIIARAPLEERGGVDRLMDRLAWSPTQQTYVPISQIVSRFEMRAEDATIFRYDRFRTVQAQANPPKGFNFNLMFSEIRGEIEAIPLPPGYRMEWGGEFEANARAYEVINQKIPFALLIMFVITILMFGKLKQPIVIWLTVPMTFCGVALGLLATDLAFTFPSFLGFLSLSGMLIKNCIVLVDEIDKRFEESEFNLVTMTEASISRLRPVILAAGTTIAGMSPLLADAFFREMAVCIMSGLAFATLLTLLAVPVFYRIALGKKLSA